MPGKSLLFSGQTVSLHSLLKFIMRTYENPQKNESTLGCQSLESIYQGVGITGYRKQKWKVKKNQRRKGSGNEEKLTLRPA